MFAERKFSLHIYRTKALLSVLLGLVLLGTAAIFFLQSTISVLDWIQYLLLTMLIAFSFFGSGYLAAHPIIVKIGDNEISITQNDRVPQNVSWEDIKAYAYYEELLLYSLKITLHNQEILSIINFKWNSQEEFRAFLQQLEIRLKARGDEEDDDTLTRSETFYGSRNKVILTMGIFLVYVGVVVLFLIRDIFSNWNPICRYYFWVVPMAFFVKMLKAK
jgi:hypothetical protein